VTERIRAGRRTVEITHPDRVMFPRAGLTKLDLARHYERVAPVMVPHVRDRPLALDTYPEGVRGGGYLIKHIPAHFPDWIARATVAKRGGEVTHVLANDRATLVYLAGQNVVTLHAWPSRADRPDHPDRLIFDLDPPHERFAEAARRRAAWATCCATSAWRRSR
jgi:bifunctional non-homologous end joining protein LigD